MSLGKVARKLKRVGKTAYQFRITSTFEYIELTCHGTWRPENLRVIWLRSHRRVQSIDVKWVPSEDRGPNGAVGRAVFDPSFSVALIVTLYGIQEEGNKFEEKEYKYYIESDGPSGRKIVASFNIDVAEYASMPSSKHTLDMSFKPVSKKISKAVLGITLQSEFIKQGTAVDDDMQSTFSAVSAGQDSLQFDDEEDEANPAHLSTVEEGQEQGLPQASGEMERSLVTLGTGERLKRTTLPAQAPQKPQRHPSPHPSPQPSPHPSPHLSPAPSPHSSPENKRKEKEKTPQSDAEARREKTLETTEGMNGAAVVGKEGEGEEEKKESKKEKKEREKQEKEKEKQEKERQKQEEKERKQNEKKEKEKEKKKPKEKTPTPETQASASTSKPDLVTVVEPPGQISGAGQPIGIVFDTGKAGEGQLSATCKGTKVGPVETEVTERSEGHYHVKFVPSMADVYMLSVRWGEKDVSGSPFLINLNLLPSPALPVKNKGREEGGAAETSDDSPAKPQEKMVDEKKDGAKEGGEEKEKEKVGKVEGDQGTKEEEKKVEEEKKEEERKEEEEEGESTVVVTDDPFEMAFQASRMLEQQQKKAQGSSEAAASPSKPGRTPVSSKEDWTPPSNHYYETMPGEGEEEGEPIPSPLDAWLGDAQFTDCFGESVSRDKLENADIIGLYFSANWCPPCRRFLPKLVKFYHHLKQNQKSFELIYISSDPSKQEMMKYMQEQQMPWVALAFDSTLADKLRVDYNVSAIPVLTIVSKEGVKLEERARKLVEQSTSSAAVLKLYNKWLEKTQQGEGAVEKKGGILKTIKSAIQKPGKEQVSELPGPALDSQHSQSQEEEKGGAGDSEGAGRVTVEQRSRPRTKPKGKDGNLVSLTVQEMEEKEEKMRHLEEVNMSLKQTNDDLNEEVAELKRQIGEFQTKLEVLESSSRQLEDEKRELMANLNIRGWLLKRGVKGPTANVWRRRYFRCDQGSKIYYYKSASEGTPQGYIDLDKLVSVQEVSAAQQDKNHATFLVQCEGRTYQLQAHDETTMRKWMSAIEYLKNWRQKNSSGAHP